MKALIEEVAKKVSKSGKTYFVVKAGGKSYTTFDEKVGQFKGKTVSYNEEAQEVGDKTYWNMRDIKVMPDEPDPRQASMLMAYAKDIVVALISAGKVEGIADALNLTAEAYRAITAIMTQKEEEVVDDETIPF